MAGPRGRLEPPPGAGWVIDASVTMPWFFPDEATPFTEALLDALGTQQVSYQISARRGGQNSAASGTLTVQFGRVSGPGAGLTIVSETFNGKPVNFNTAQAA